MEFEDILSDVGGYGKFQKYMTAFFLIPAPCILSWVGMHGLFMVSIPEHWCFVDQVANSNLSVSQQRTLVSPPEDPSCSMYDVNYTDYLGSNFTNDSIVVSCTTGWQYVKKDYESTASTKWNLVCDHRYFASLILTLQNVGRLVFTPIYGFLADRYGRRTVYFSLLVLAFVTDLASVTVEDFTAFAVMRTIHGSVFPTLFTLTLIIISEIVAPEIRVHMNGIITASWTVGLSSLPLIAYLSGNWVNLGLVCSVACASMLVYWRFIPESPCWLISRGRYEEATTIMEQIGKVNGKPQERTYLFNQLRVLGQNIQKQKVASKTSPYLLLKYPRIRKHFLILSFCWTAFYMTNYGFVFNLRNLAGNEFVNFFLLSVVEIPGNIMFWILMDRVGRRWTSSIGFIVLGFVCLGPLSGFQYSDIIFSTIGKFISSGMIMVANQQGTELFPTVTRSFAIGLGKTLSNAVSLVVPFFADLGEYGKEWPFIVMGCTSLATGILASFLPETLNEKLPQSVSDAEEFGKDQNLFSWIRKSSPITSKESSNLQMKAGKGTKEEVALVSTSYSIEKESESPYIQKLSDEPFVEISGASKLKVPLTDEAIPMLDNI